MKYIDFEEAFSSERMSKYVMACNGDTRKAMTLYRYNLRLSQEMFTLVSCFEVTLRNSIDRQLRLSLGSDWLRDAILPGGFIQILALTRLVKSSTMLIVNWFASRTTAIPNCFHRWNSVFGSISTPMFIML